MRLVLLVYLKWKLMETLMLCLPIASFVEDFFSRDLTFHSGEFVMARDTAVSMITSH